MGTITPFHDQILGNDLPAQAIYRFVDTPNKVNQAAIVPKRPTTAAKRSLEQLQADEINYLSENGSKKVTKETLLGTSLQSIPRKNYETIIALDDTVSNFFQRDGFRTVDAYVPNSPLNGQKYEEDGKEVEVHSGVTSSFNRLADTVTLLRKVEGGDGDSHCYAGRVDQKGPTPLAKAEEMAKTVFLGEFNGNGGKGIEKIGTDTYTLQFAVQSVIGSAQLPILRSEFKSLKDEIKAYELLAKQTKENPLKIVDPETKKTLYVKVLPPIISQTQFNWINQLSMLGDSWVLGEVDAKEISAKADAVLFEKAEKNEKPEIRDTVELLKQGNLKPWEEILVRAYLCHLLNIAEVIHCKSSVDRTGVAVAIVSSMRQWIQSGREIPKDENGKYNILKIASEIVVKKGTTHPIYPFKELFALNLRKGLIATEFSRGQRGYKLNRGWSQSLALQDLLPARYLKDYDAKDLLQRITVRVVSFILGILTIIGTLGGILKAIRMKSWKGLDVWIAPLKAFRTGVFPKKLIDETSLLGRELLYKGSKKKKDPTSHLA